MYEKFPVILDTNILVHGMVEGDPSSYEIIYLLQTYALKLYTTKAIKYEYELTFSKPSTYKGILITKTHRKKLASLLNASHSVNSLTKTGKIASLKTETLNHLDPQDLKFITAADMAVGYIGGIIHLISNDQDLTSLTNELRPLNILVYDSNSFMNYYRNNAT